MNGGTGPVSLTLAPLGPRTEPSRASALQKVDLLNQLFNSPTHTLSLLSRAEH